MRHFDQMEERLDEASQLLKAMASPNRLMILCALADGEMSVTQLATALDLRQSTVSQSLARLRLDRLVTTRRDAQTIYYSLAHGAADEIIRVLYKYYCASDEQ